VTTTLAQINPGNKARIIRVRSHNITNRKLADMGVTRNAVVMVKRIAPLGDPIEISVRGYSLAIRKADAESIDVQEVQ